MLNSSLHAPIVSIWPRNMLLLAPKSSRYGEPLSRADSYRERIGHAEGYIAADSYCMFPGSFLRFSRAYRSEAKETR